MSSDASRILCDNCGKNSFKKSHLLPDPAQTSQLRDILRAHTLSFESSHFHNVIAESPDELARYDSEIQQLQDRLDGLRSERATLESYANGCRSVLSPVRRLPAELLVDIFDICAPPGSDHISEMDTPTDELERLAKKYLLQLSKVCSCWYGVVMGTPRLWSTIVVDTFIWNEVLASPPTLIDLVASSLERSGSHPLVVECAFSKRESSAVLVLELLAQHSSRWRKIHLWNYLPSFHAIAAAAKGNIPLLEELVMHNVTESWTETGIFALAPRLTHVRFAGRAAQIPTLPWDQVRLFTYQSNSPDLVETLARVSHLSTGASCGLVLDISNISPPINLPPIVSSVSTFLLFATSADQEILGAILESFTFPCLHKLVLRGKANGPPLFWHQHHFLAFASRSALQASLTAFEIKATIQDEELLQCLSVLPLLERLTLWECADQSHALITDNLLRRLAWRPDHTCLIPSLAGLFFISMFRFGDNAFLDLVTSRIVPGRKGDQPFVTGIYWLPQHEREFSPEFIAQLEELEEREDLVLTIGPNPHSKPQ